MFVFPAVATFFTDAIAQAYIIAQLFGGIVGAALVYANYFHAISIVEGGTNTRTLSTAGLFGLYPVRTSINVDIQFTLLSHSLSSII